MKKGKGKVQIAKGVSVSKAKAAQMRKAPGGSNVGKYKNIPKGKMALDGSFPIDNPEHARAALAYAHDAPPSKRMTIKRKVKAAYPSIQVKGLKNKKK